MAFPHHSFNESPIFRKTGFTELVCSGGFRNRRQVYDWEGFTLELDETRFEHGTLYEIEVETVREGWADKVDWGSLSCQIRRRSQTTDQATPG